MRSESTVAIRRRLACSPLRDDRRIVDELPEISRKAAALRRDRQDCPRVADCRFDLAAMANDARVRCECVHALRVKARYRLRLEIREQRAIAVALE